MRNLLRLIKRLRQAQYRHSITNHKEDLAAVMVTGAQIDRLLLDNSLREEVKSKAIKQIAQGQKLGITPAGIAEKILNELGL